MKQEATVVILAAGLGTRMRSQKAKVLHEAGGDTLLNHVIKAALAIAPPEKIVAVIGHQAEDVRKSVPFTGVRFALQAEQKGTGHAVLCAREAIGTPQGQLMILNGDGPLLKAETLRRLLESRSRAQGGSIVTTELADPTGYGRIVRNGNGFVAEIVEQKVANAEQQKIREVNPGVYCFDGPLFWDCIGKVRPDNPAGEYYLTDVVSLLTRAGREVYPVLVGDSTELLGINTRLELAEADRILRRRKATELMLSGVTIEFPETVLIDADVHVSPDTVLETGVQLRGKTHIGANCRVGSGAILRNCQVAESVNILPYVVAEETTFEKRSIVGPFARFRMQANVEEDAQVGNFVELKKTRLGKKSKANHLAYLGDATIGAGSNIGAGTITCNYDGQKKHQTLIGDGTFVGSNSTLVAPVKLESGAYIAAGSVITKDVPADALAIGRAYQVDKPGWAAKRRGSQTNSDS